MRTAKRVFFEGRVQGVGFRVTARRAAMGFEVTGWVRNLADGRVEMLAIGDEEEVAAFLEEIDDILGSLIRERLVEDAAEAEAEAEPGGVKGFSIRFD